MVGFLYAECIVGLYIFCLGVWESCKDGRLEHLQAQIDARLIGHGYDKAFYGHWARRIRTIVSSCTRETSGGCSGLFVAQAKVALLDG